MLLDNIISLLTAIGTAAEAIENIVNDLDD